MPWCTTSLRNNESIEGGGRLKSKFSRLSVRDHKNKEGKILHSTGGRSPLYTKTIMRHSTHSLMLPVPKSSNFRKEESFKNKNK